jgi:hypothetical protein
MKRIHLAASALLFLPALAAADSGTPPVPADPFKDMAFLAGHCWKGSFPGQAQTDEHCFEWVYEHHFLRDRHTVHGEGHADYLGETVYYWDPEQKKVQYLYIENQGGFSKGDVTPVEDGLMFPPTTYVDAGKEQVYRSHWKRDGDSAYEVITEFKTKDGWILAWKVRMEQQPAPK